MIQLFLEERNLHPENQNLRRSQNDLCGEQHHILPKSLGGTGFGKFDTVELGKAYLLELS